MQNRQLPLALFSLFLSAALICSAGEGTDRLQRLREQAIVGFPGLDRQALEEVEGELEVLSKEMQQPESAVVLACRGVALTVMAKEGNFLRRRNLFQRGSRAIDEAARLAPEEPWVLLLRAQHAAVLPKALGREEIAHQDFERLLDLLAEPDAADALSDRLHARIRFYAASWYLRNNDAERAVEVLRAADRLEIGDEELGRKIERVRRLATERS